jgi:hypothetical protein
VLSILTLLRSQPNSQVIRIRRKSKFTLHASRLISGACVWKISETQIVFQSVLWWSIKLSQKERFEHFHGSTENAEGNSSHGRKLFMLIFSRTTMKISEKAWNVSRMTGKLFMVFILSMYNSTWTVSRTYGKCFKYFSWYYGKK